MSLQTTAIFDGCIRSTVERVAVVAAAALLTTAPSYAGNVAFVSATGSGHACTATAPCGDIADGYGAATLTTPSGVARVLCLTPVPALQTGNDVFSNISFEINCPQSYVSSFYIQGANTSGTLRGLTFGDSLSASQIFYSGSGTLILEDCVFSNATGIALDLEPTGPLTLVIRNSRISSAGGAGILLKPGAGGSLKATFDHVIVTRSNGGGIRADSTDGVINLDISNSEISNNANNGVMAIAGSNQNIVSIQNSVFARNGQAGVGANGTNAGVLVATTLFDQNAGGATSVVNAGYLYTYDNNSVVGSMGSGFPATAPLH